MKNTTRAVGTISALLLAGGSLAACSSGGGGGSTDPDGEIAGTISIITTEETAKELATAFTEAHPKAKVDVQVIGDIGTNQQTIRTQLTSGTGPDVFTVFPGNGSPTAVQVLASAGDFMYDLSDREWVKDVAPGLIESGSADGSLFTALFQSNGIGAILNEDTLAQVGLTAPTTMPELIQFCADARDAGKVAFAMGGADQWVTQMPDYALSASLVYGPDPEFNERQLNGDETFPDSAWVEVVDKQLELIDAGCFQDDLLGADYEAQKQMVANGDALGAVQGNWMIGELKEIAPETEFTLYPLPATESADDTYMPIGAAAGYAVNTKTDNLPTALAWIDFIMSPEGLQIASEASGAIPAYAVESLEQPESTRFVVQYLEEGRTIPFPDQGWPNARVQSAHLAGLQDLFAGTTDTNGLLTAMQAAFDEGA